MGHAEGLEPRRYADARNRLRHVFVRDLELSAVIGVHLHEKKAPQRIRINIDLAVLEEGGAPLQDQLDQVVCYEEVVSGVRQLIARGHVNLVETLAERIAELCLDDRRVQVARVRVEKLDVLPDCASVGVEIERSSRRS